jgi:hypothetical protein
MPLSDADAHELDVIEVSRGAASLLKMARRFYRCEADACELAEAVTAVLGADKAESTHTSRQPLAVMHAIVLERLKRRGA